MKEGIKRKRANPVEDEEWGVDIKARGAKEAEEFWVEPGPVAIARFLGLGRSVPKPPPKQAIVALSMKVSLILTPLWLFLPAEGPD